MIHVLDFLLTHFFNIFLEEDMGPFSWYTAEKSFHFCK